MKYYVIKCSEDGDVRVIAFTKEALERLMTEEGSGLDNVDFNPDLSGDPQYWGGQALIIKGEPVVPLVVERVVRKELP